MINGPASFSTLMSLGCNWPSFRGTRSSLWLSCPVHYCRTGSVACIGLDWSVNCVSAETICWLSLWAVWSNVQKLQTSALSVALDTYIGQSVRHSCNPVHTAPPLSSGGQLMMIISRKFSITCLLPLCHRWCIVKKKDKKFQIWKCSIAACIWYPCSWDLWLFSLRDFWGFRARDLWF